MRRECRDRFPHHQFQRKPLVIDPGTHHGTCVTHVPWCMLGSITRGSGKTFPAFPVHAQPVIFRIWQEAHAFFIEAKIGPYQTHCKYSETGIKRPYQTYCKYSETGIKRPLNFVVSQDRWCFTAGRINIILWRLCQTDDENCGFVLVKLNRSNHKGSSVSLYGFPVSLYGLIGLIIRVPVYKYTPIRLLTK